MQCFLGPVTRMWKPPHFVTTRLTSVVPVFKNRMATQEEVRSGGGRQEVVTLSSPLSVSFSWFQAGSSLIRVRKPKCTIVVFVKMYFFFN